jgi:hypothetical protein
MNDRYIVQHNKETYLYDIFDTVLGDRLFCSFTTEERANEVINRKNAGVETAKSSNVRGIAYTGPARNVHADIYRTPKFHVSVNNGLVVFQYD